MTPAPTGPFAAGPSQAGSPFGAPRPGGLGQFQLASGRQPSGLSKEIHMSPGSSSTASQRNESIRTPADDPREADEAEVATLYLEPSAYEGKGKGKWVESGRFLGVSPCSVGGELGIWVSKEPSSKRDANPGVAAALSLADRSIYFTSPSTLPDPVATFYTETYTLFASLQRIVATSIRLPARSAGIDARSAGMAGVWDHQGRMVGLDSVLGPPGADTVRHMRRLVGMYLEELARLRGMPGLDAGERTKWAEVYHIFHLAEILYLPQDGRGEGLVGEELLDWVNDVDPHPDNAVGTTIMSTREPWSHPSFWPYVTRCLLRGFNIPASSFLRSLASHPNPTVSKLAVLLSTHLTLLPRSTNTASYPVDHQFISAHRSWVSRFRAELSAAVGGRKKGEWLEKQWGRLEEDLVVVVELMEGKAERVLEEAADWREAVGAWGVLVDVGLRRDDLPATMKTILKTIPADPYVIANRIESDLCTGQIASALEGCHSTNPWLAAHLGDVFDKLALIPDDEERFEMSLRDYFILEYADVLAGNPKHGAFWRITADYLAVAGDEGRARLKEHILHTALGLDHTAAPAASVVEAAAGIAESGMDVDDKVDNRFEHFAALRETCVELRLEDEWKIISQCMADRLVRRAEFGIAATMYFQAEDGEGLGRLAEKLLDAFVYQGEEEYLRILDTLPTTLLNEAPLALQQLHLQSTNQLPPGQAPISIFASRLAFLAELRDYLLFLRQDARDVAAQRLVGLLASGIAPVGFWAILLVESIPLLEDPDILISSNDTFELMRVLQEVTASSAFDPSLYLSQAADLLARRAELGAGSAGNPTLNGPHATATNWKPIRNKLEQVRLALARNLARALVAGFDTPF